MSDGIERTEPAEAEPRFLGVVIVRPRGTLGIQEWTRLTAGIEQITRDFDTARPTDWSASEAVLRFVDGTPGAVATALMAARAVWQRSLLDLQVPVAIAVHGTYAPPDEDEAAIAAGRALAADGPPDAICATDDVLEIVSEAGFDGGIAIRRHSSTGLDVAIFPASAATRTALDRFAVSADREQLEIFRQYARSPEVRLLRYVGFRLSKREPPCLDVRDVFVPPGLSAVSRHAGSRRVDRQLPKALLEARGVPGPLIDAVPWGTLLQSAELSPPRSLSDLFGDQRRIVILGDPGAGKTTILRWLAVVAASGSLSTAWNLGVAERLLPLPVSAGRLAELAGAADLERPTIIELLARYFHERGLGSLAGISAFLERVFGAGEALLLVDGLDEIGPADREPMRARIEALAASHPKCRYIVTSRIVGYARSPLPGATEATVNPFNDDQVRRWLSRFTSAYRLWETGETASTLAERAAEEVYAAIRADGRLRGLARNPFMLAGLALIHRAEGRLPVHRVQAYEIFARALCESWGSARRLVAGDVRGGIDYEAEGIPVLGELALGIHRRFPSGVAPEAFVLRTIAHALARHRGIGNAEAEQVAREFLQRAGADVQILVERGARQWGFLHLTFQEFFAAAGLQAAERFESTARRHLFDPRWSEIIRLGVGYMAMVQVRPEATRRFIEKLLVKPPVLGEAWEVELLGRHWPIALALLADSADALPLGLQQRVIGGFVDWCVEMPPFIPGTAIDAIATSDIVPSLCDALARRFDAEKSPWRRMKLCICLFFCDPAVGFDRLRRLSDEPKWQELMDAVAPMVLPAVESEERRRPSWPPVEQEADELLTAMTTEKAAQNFPVIQLIRDARADSRAGHQMLLAELNRPEAFERAVILIALAGMHRADSEPAIVAGLDDEHWAVRAAAAVACMLLPVSVIPPRLVKMSRCPGDQPEPLAERESALWALWRLSDPGRRRV